MDACLPNALTLPVFDSQRIRQHGFSGIEIEAGTPFSDPTRSSDPVDPPTSARTPRCSRGPTDFDLAPIWVDRSRVQSHLFSAVIYLSGYGARRCDGASVRSNLGSTPIMLLLSGLGWLQGELLTPDETWLVSPHGRSSRPGVGQEMGRAAPIVKSGIKSPLSARCRSSSSHAFRYQIPGAFHVAPP